MEEDEVGLLRRIAPILKTALQFWVSSPDPNVVRAREKSVKHGGDRWTGPVEDSEDLCHAIDRLPSSWQASPKHVPPITGVLRCVNDKFLSINAVRESPRQYPDDYPALRHFLDSYGEEKDAEAYARTVLCILYSSEIDCSELSASLKECQNLFSLFIPHYSDDLDLEYWAVARDDLAVWSGAQDFYEQAEGLHTALSSLWVCKCEFDCITRSSRFTLTTGPPDPEGKEIGCIVGWPDHRNGVERWHFGRLLYCKIPADCMTNVSGKQDSPQPLLAAMSDGRYVRLTRPPCACSIDSLRLICDAPTIPTLLHSWDDDLISNALAQSYTKHRLSLALLLSYAYYYLGGTGWWLYDDEGLPHLYGPPDYVDLEAMQLPFLNRGQVVGEYDTHSIHNHSMPNLPSFGKILMELLLGKRIDWDDLEEEILNCEEAEEEYASPIVIAVKACTNTDQSSVFDTGQTIKDSPFLKQIFLDKVLFRIQHVVSKGFGVDIEQLLKQHAGVIGRHCESPSNPSAFVSGRSPMTVLVQRSAKRDRMDEPQDEDDLFEQSHDSKKPRFD